MAAEWIRLTIGAILLLAGIFAEILAIIGVFRFNYVLNRMQVAATADTMGLLLVLAGLMVFSGFNIMTLKMLIIIIFFWLGGPVSSHLIARIERLTNEASSNEYDVVRIPKKSEKDTQEINAAGSGCEKGQVEQA